MKKVLNKTVKYLQNKERKTVVVAAAGVVTSESSLQNFAVARSGVAVVGDAVPIVVVIVVSWIAVAVTQTASVGEIIVVIVRKVVVVGKIVIVRQVVTTWKVVIVVATSTSTVSAVVVVVRVTSVVLGASLAGWMRGICLDGVQITVNIWKKFFFSFQNQLSLKVWKF